MNLEYLDTSNLSWQRNGNRPSFAAIWLHLAFDLAERSTCTRGSVGCVIVTADNQIISTGYNGAPHGMPHCTEVGCDVQKGHCVRVVHAEQNALLQAPTKSLLRDAVAYVTVEPCQRCENMLRQMGIGWVYYAEGLAEWRARNQRA